MLLHIYFILVLFMLLLLLLSHIVYNFFHHQHTNNNIVCCLSFTSHVFAVFFFSLLNFILLVLLHLIYHHVVIWNYKNENVKYDCIKKNEYKNEIYAHKHTNRAKIMKNDREIIRFVWNVSDMYNIAQYINFIKRRLL